MFKLQFRLNTLAPPPLFTARLATSTNRASEKTRAVTPRHHHAAHQYHRGVVDEHDHVEKGEGVELDDRRAVELAEPSREQLQLVADSLRLPAVHSAWQVAVTVGVEVTGVVVVVMMVVVGSL